jgi:hypothetical protein
VEVDIMKKKAKNIFMAMMRGGHAAKKQQRQFRHQI